MGGLNLEGDDEVVKLKVEGIDVSGREVKIGNRIKEIIKRNE